LLMWINLEQCLPSLLLLVWRIVHGWTFTAKCRHCAAAAAGVHGSAIQRPTSPDGLSEVPGAYRYGHCLWEWYPELALLCHHVSDWVRRWVLSDSILRRQLQRCCPRLSKLPPVYHSFQPTLDANSRCAAQHGRGSKQQMYTGMMQNCN
jgi:hypothetical protein